MIYLVIGIATVMALSVCYAVVRLYRDQLQESETRREAVEFLLRRIEALEGRTLAALETQRKDQNRLSVLLSQLQAKRDRKGKTHPKARRRV